MGTIVVEGDLPRDGFAKQFEEICGDIVVHDDSLIAGQGGGLANVFVWLEGAPRDVHPDRVAEAESAVRMTIDGCRFQPHAATVQVEQAFAFLNRDDLGHSPRIETFANPPDGRLLPSAGGVPGGRSLTRTFADAERLPCSVRCAIHPWMSANVLPLDHPYATTTDAAGRFRIEKLPAGERRFRVWHERTGWLDEGFVTIDDSPARDLSQASGGRQPSAAPLDPQPFAADKGRFTLTIQPGETDLGTIRVPAAAFER